MSNIDSLLDLDDMNSDPPPEVKDTAGATSPRAADPFDPFATHYDQTPSDGDQKAQFTGFDPFAQIVESPDTISPSDPFAGSDPFAPTTGSNNCQDLGAIGDAISDFDPFSRELVKDQGHTNLIGAALTSPEFEGPEGSYDLLQGTAVTNDLIEEEDEEDEEDEEENSVVEKDDLPEKSAKTASVNDMAGFGDCDQQAYASQFIDHMGDLNNEASLETRNSHSERYELEDDFVDEESFNVHAREDYSPPDSPEAQSGEVVITEGGQYDGLPAVSPSRLEDTLPTFQQPKRYVKPEEKRESKAAPGVIIMSHLGAGDNRCALCDKRVYEMEKMIADKAIYHKMCFKCSHCKRILSLGNFASMEGMLYCKPHFIEMFKTKGNYDEGFGKEKHSKQWQKDVTPDQRSNIPDDKVDDGIESVQNLSNIKSRFQGRDEKPPMPGDVMNRSQRSSVSPSNGHVNGDRTPPEVVNRSESSEDILGRELPPVNMARSMASKFRDLESTEMNPDRKPVRKITPPREEVERDVEYYRETVEHREDVIRAEDAAEKEDELPPPSFTKNMLARFKEMEDTQKPPPSPDRSTSPTKRTHRPIVTHTYMKSSPDEGIADTEPSTNGHQRQSTEVIRESDKNEMEELPERGFTKSLVSQWRQIEQTAGSSSSGGKSPLAPRQFGTTSVSHSSYRQANSQEMDENREVVRESDNFEEENLPPPSYTKNMLAKFQNIQHEAQKDSATTPTKKGPVLITE